MLRADAANAVPDGKTGGPATLPFPTGQARRKDRDTDRGALPRPILRAPPASSRARGC
jgi:hypothetical protein